MPDTKFGGLLTQRYRWGVSWRGWLVLAASVGISGYLVMTNLYFFLAVTDRVESNTLVVEGWVHEYAIEAAAAEFRTGRYQHLFTTGGPVVGKGGYINDYNTSASVGADLLKKAGLPKETVQMVPSRVNGRDRTFSSAVALKVWLREHNLSVQSLNVLTEEAHARRTRLLFEKALGPDVKVGIIAVASPDYDSKHWWRYSDGLREVLGESIAYVYARFFFHPSVSSAAIPGIGDSRRARAGGQHCRWDSFRTTGLRLLVAGCFAVRGYGYQLHSPSDNLWLAPGPISGSGVGRGMLAFGGNLTAFNIINYFTQILTTSCSSGAMSGMQVETVQ